ncbi:sigma-70 family RNA polymerase sigma factor [uncultured Kordia sp.]|uniref:RNA polymerase sigma factor n=1 Tax=uncultured Kordia sp. TaxID=507699 RepID=UPI00262E3A02|nr:sigma-70 family RNA polymerase sigma factor [uncultured Kordia sp.]
MNVVETTLIDDLKNPKTQQKAFRELVSTYKERLYWHIRRMVTNHEDADDVLQNTFIKVFRSIDKFKGDSKLYSWMYRIATNEAITFINQRAKKAGISSEEIQNHLVNNLQADVYFEGEEIQLKLQKAIATLPQKQQIVFNMKYFEDITYNDMSEVLDTSVGALKASYHHAVKKIEQFLTTEH